MTNQRGFDSLVTAGMAKSARQRANLVDFTARCYREVHRKHSLNLEAFVKKFFKLMAKAVDRRLQIAGRQRSLDKRSRLHEPAVNHESPFGDGLNAFDLAHAMRNAWIENRQAIEERRNLHQSIAALEALVRIEVRPKGKNLLAEKKSFSALKAPALPWG